MGAQFGRLEIYSRKKDAKGRNTAFIFAEARRDPSASLHVSVPDRAIKFGGSPIDELERIHDEAASKARIAVKGGRVRRLRQDQNTLLAIVISHPYKTEDIITDEAKKAELKVFERHIKNWLRSKYGSDLKTVVRHMDEKYYHLHAFVLPLSDPEMKASRYHPGIMAKEAVMTKGKKDGTDKKLLRRLGDKAYRDAMRAWQDELYAEVSQFSGLTRLGPKRQRLTREQWHAQQSQARALQQAHEAVRAREVILQAENADKMSNLDQQSDHQSALMKPMPDVPIVDGRTAGDRKNAETEVENDPLDSFGELDTVAKSSRVAIGITSPGIPVNKQAVSPPARSRHFENVNVSVLAARERRIEELERQVSVLTSQKNALLEKVRTRRANTKDASDDFIDELWAFGLETEPRPPSLDAGF